MLLVLDVGNTNVTCAIFRDTDVLDYLWRLSAQPIRTVDEYGLATRHHLTFRQIDSTALQTVAVDDDSTLAGNYYTYRESHG